MKRIDLRRVIVCLCVIVGVTGCFGPMNATSRLKTWNREIENRWAGEAVYVTLRIPYGGVYGLFALSDFLIWNSIEFWGGENPIDPPAPERIERIRELDSRRHGGGR